MSATRGDGRTRPLRCPEETGPYALLCRENIAEASRADRVSRACTISGAQMTTGGPTQGGNLIRRAGEWPGDGEPGPASPPKIITNFVVWPICAQNVRYRGRSLAGHAPT